MFQCYLGNTFERAALQPCNYLEDTFVCGTNTSGCLDNEDDFTLDSLTTFLLQRWRFQGSVDTASRSEPVVIHPSAIIQIDFSSQKAGLSAPSKGVKDVMSLTPQEKGAAIAGTAGPLLVALCCACIVMIHLRQKLRRTEAKVMTLEAKSCSNAPSLTEIRDGTHDDQVESNIQHKHTFIPQSKPLPTEGPREADPEVEIKERAAQHETQESAAARGDPLLTAHELEADYRKGIEKKSAKWWWKGSR
jgi:hypothetical protein